MSHDIARGGYTKALKNKSVDSKRHYNDGADLIKNSQVSPEAIEKYTKR
jgi:hypothetical protein